MSNAQHHVTAIGNGVIAAEDRIFESIIAVSELIGNVARARLDLRDHAGADASAGQAELIRLAQTSQQLVRTSSDVLRVHAGLSDLQKRHFGDNHPVCEDGRRSIMGALPAQPGTPATRVH